MHLFPIVLVIDFFLFLQQNPLQRGPNVKTKNNGFFTCSMREFTASMRAEYGILLLLTVNFPPIK
jgi:hypothetical protein